MIHEKFSKNMYTLTLYIVLNKRIRNFIKYFVFNRLELHWSYMNIKIIFYKSNNIYIYLILYNNKTIILIIFKLNRLLYLFLL